MNRRYRLLRRYVLWLTDMLLSLAIYIFAYKVTRGGTVGGILMNQRFVLVSIAFIATVLGLLTDLHHSFTGVSALRELGSEIQYNFVLDVTLIVLTYMLSFHTISRQTLLIFTVLNVSIMFLLHRLIKFAVNRIFDRSAAKNNLIIITDKANHEEVLKNFNGGYAFNVIGTISISDKCVCGKVNDHEINEDLDTLSRSLVPENFDDVFINAPTLPKKLLFEMIDRFADMGVTIHIAMDLPEHIGQKSSASDFGQSYLCVNYAAVQHSTAKLAIKRIVDIIGGIVGLILTGIIFLFVAPAIKLDSPGPVIFAQTRIGKNGKRFKFYKFRSMYMDAEERKKELMKDNKMDGLMFKMDDDPRITKVGKFIRKTSLDEFPQFWNVLKGDMSLVGTRPPTEDEFAKYNEHYRKRLSMKPGITGLWQVSGRSDITDFDEVIKLDLAYIENWSLGEDAKILLKTFGAVFGRKGAE